MYPTADLNGILNLAGLQVRTVHGFIGQESDIAIIVTGAQDGPCKPNDWVFAIVRSISNAISSWRNEILPKVHICPKFYKVAVVKLK